MHLLLLLSMISWKTSPNMRSGDNKWCALHGAAARKSLFEQKRQTFLCVKSLGKGSVRFVSEGVQPSLFISRPQRSRGTPFFAVVCGISIAGRVPMLFSLVSGQVYARFGDWSLLFSYSAHTDQDRAI